MTTAGKIDRRTLDVIVSNILWPDEISDSLLEVERDLERANKLEALADSFIDDALLMKETYFEGYQNDDTEILMQRARQENWGVEQKVIIGAIDGLEYFWFLLEKGLSGVSWGPERLRGTLPEVLNRAKEYVHAVTSKHANTNASMTPTEIRFAQLAVEIREKGLYVPHLMVNQKTMGALEAITRESVRLKRNGWEKDAEVLRQRSQDRRELREFLSPLLQYAKLWENDHSGMKFVSFAVDEIKREPVGQKSYQRNLPFLVGTAAAADKARELYAARYAFLS